MSRSKIAALAVAFVLTTGCATSAEQDPAPAPTTGDAFLEITDCRELELLAAAEVDRIAAAQDQATIDDATTRFNKIVTHRDAIC